MKIFLSNKINLLHHLYKCQFQHYLFHTSYALGQYRIESTEINLGNNYHNSQLH